MVAERTRSADVVCRVLMELVVVVVETVVAMGIYGDSWSVALRSFLGRPSQKAARQTREARLVAMMMGKVVVCRSGLPCSFFVVMVVARVAVVVVLVCRAPTVAWGLFGPVLGRFGCPIGTLWGPLGALLGLSGALLGHLGSQLAKKGGSLN